MSDRSLLPPSATATSERSVTSPPASPTCQRRSARYGTRYLPGRIVAVAGLDHGTVGVEALLVRVIKRERIRQAVEIHRRRGTKGSVRRVVESFGAGVSIREWWQMDPPGEPHTFELVIAVAATTPPAGCRRTSSRRSGASSRCALTSLYRRRHCRRWHWPPGRRPTGYLSSTRLNRGMTGSEPDSYRCRPCRDHQRLEHRDRPGHRHPCRVGPCRLSASPGPDSAPGRDQAGRQHRRGCGRR
ncbi:phage tail protein I [Halolamina pelagica]|uniref:Phage tail protein I n=1 Tax=Halolamina pelagica TaxID=699431 RepID=A0A0P7H682_9EURY|nr:phage tail protein I [Halolamina pelagica]